MTVRLYQVDAFTDVPFSGNPAAVVLLDHEVDAGWMQRLAQENNLSETAFVWPQPEGYGLRWFTPVMEVKLCGHATLASAHVLWETEALEPGDPACFHTRSGWLRCERNARIEMDFPARRSPVVPADGAVEAAQVLEALGGRPTFVGKNVDDYLVVLETEAELRALAPDFLRLANSDSRGVIVTAPSARAEFDFVSRFFAPAAGIDEDPVTGSAHCALAPYWAERLGRTSMVGFQASPRGGKVYTELRRDRVILGGSAVTVLRAELSPPAAPPRPA